jgi:hypothetical protein
MTTFEPVAVGRLPHDRHGRPVPWFVAWIDGVPDFRVLRSNAPARALAGNLCWVCGQQFTPIDSRAFVVGPMCVVNKNSAEPPAHYLCAAYSAQTCPFLTRPGMTRRDRHLPEGVEDPPGGFITRNPGVAAVWVARSNTWRPVAVDGGLLFDLGQARRVEWYAQGREATRAEVMDSLRTGLPALRELAELEEGGQARLDRMYETALELVPRAPEEEAG